MRPILWLLLVFCLALVCVQRFWSASPVQTNLLTLLPPTERDPFVERAVSALGESAGSRAVFLVGHANGGHAAGAARDFAANLRNSGAFRRVTAEIPALDPGRLAEPYLDHRFGVLSAEDRKSLVDGRGDLEQRLRRRILSPFRMSVATDVATDPFGFLDGYVSALPYRMARLSLRDWLLVAQDGSGVYVMVIAELPGSAYDGEVQRSVVAAVESARTGLRGLHPEAELLRMGAVFYADDARERAQREVDIIGAGSLLGIVLLILAVFRSIKPLLLGLLSVGIGLTAATAVTLLVHGEIHLITMVFGASLIGEAIDYSIQYFGAHVAAGSGWNPQTGMQSVRPGLTLALTTSVLGYAALMAFPFPAVSQIALFALVGLVAAFLSVLILLPALLKQPFSRDISAVTAYPARFLSWWERCVGSRGSLGLVFVLLLAAAPGWMLLRSDDDIRLLISPSALLAGQEAKIRALTGLGNSSQFFLVEGASAEELLRREEGLTDKLGRMVAAGVLSDFHAVSSFVPSVARQSENKALLRHAGLGDEKSLAALFERYGLRDELAHSISGDFNRDDRFLVPETWLSSVYSASFRHLWLGESDGTHGSAVIPYGFSSVSALAAAAEGLPGVTLVDKADSVSRLFRDCRRWGGLGLLVASALVYLALARRYGWAGGIATLLPTAVGMAIALAVSGYSGSPTTLFNVMGLMLVLGVGVNYAIFLREGRMRDGVTFTAVLVSAATTVLSFGLLALSSTPALSQFGATLLVGIGASVLLAPMTLSFARPGHAR